VRRAWRAIWIALVLAMGGVVISTAIAEFIGWSGVVMYDAAAPQRFVVVAGRVVHAYDIRGAGWRYLYWTVTTPGHAAVEQYMYDKHISYVDLRLAPSYLHADPPETLPRWAHLWDPADWPPDQDFFRRPREYTEIEVGAGWPLPAFGMDWGNARPNEYRGGMELATKPGSGLRFRLWRPIPLGLLLDSLFWGAPLVALVGAARLWTQVRRRRRGACTACGYDLRGLADGALCPECGAAGKGGTYTLPAAGF
jgi:hypothetical protein